MDDFANDAPIYNTAGPMMPPNQPSRPFHTPGPTPSGQGSAERRRKVDSVASLNEIAERDIAEFMSTSSRSLSQAFSPATPVRGMLFNDIDSFSMPGSSGFPPPYPEPELYGTDLRAFPKLKEMAPAQSSTTFGNFPLMLQHYPSSLLPSQAGYGPPVGPSRGSPPPPMLHSQFVPINQIMTIPAPIAIATTPSTPSIPGTRFGQAGVSSMISASSPPTSAMSNIPVGLPPSSLPNAATTNGTHQRERSSPQSERTRERSSPPTNSVEYPSSSRSQVSENFRTSRQPPSLKSISTDEKKEDDNDITISFRPKISLVKGEIVRLVLGEFQGSDRSNFAVSSIPSGAFTSASWTGSSQSLALMVGKEIPAHERISVIIPAKIGIRKVHNRETEQKSVERQLPPNSSAASSSTKSSSMRSMWKDAINLELKLQKSIMEIANNVETFKSEVVLDVARAAGIFPTSLQVSSLQAGSIIVNLAMAPDSRDANGRNAHEIAENLMQQAKDTSSLLFRGKHTCKTVSVEIAPSAHYSSPARASDQSSRWNSEILTPEEERKARAEEKRKKFLQTSTRPEKDTSTASSNEPVGIDISFAINLRPPGVVVADLKPDGAAVLSGQLCKGDLITKIDGKALTAAVSKNDVNAMLLDRPGSTVSLEIIRANTKSGNLETHNVMITRLAGRGPSTNAQSKLPMRQAAADEDEFTFDDVPTFDEIPDSEGSEEYTAIPSNESQDHIQQGTDGQEALTQAEWARRMLQQKPAEERKTVQTMNLDAVRQQAQWAKEQLNNAPEQGSDAAKFDASSVAQQMQWAKEQLSRQEDRDTTTKFNADSVAQQAQWAKEQLANRPEHDNSPSKFDAASVAQQAQWAKGQLNNLPQQEKTSKFDSNSVAQQAQWAKEQLSNLPEKDREAKFDPESVAQQAKWAKEQIQQRSA